MTSTKRKGLAITGIGFASLVVFETAYGAPLFLLAGLILVAMGVLTTYRGIAWQ